MMWVVHPVSVSGSWFFTDPGSRGQKGTGYRIRIRNTGYINTEIILFQATDILLLETVS